MTPETIEPRYDIEESAKFLGISTQSVINLVYIGKLKPLNREYGVPVRNWVFSITSLKARKESSDNNKAGMGGGWRAANSKRLKKMKLEQRIDD